MAMRQRYKPKLKVTRAIPTHPRAKAKMRLKPMLPQLKRLQTILRRSTRRLQRKRPRKKPRRKKLRKKALTLVKKAIANKAEASKLEARKKPKTAQRRIPRTQVPMTKKNQRNDHDKTERLFLNS